VAVVLLLGSACISPPARRRMCFSSVVLPAPRKPDNTVTGRSLLSGPRHGDVVTVAAIASVFSLFAFFRLPTALLGIGMLDPNFPKWGLVGFHLRLQDSYSRPSPGREL
jgi:hypothetical protein